MNQLKINSVKLHWLCAFFVIVITFACQMGEKKFIPDVSDINVDFKINRFEQDLFAIDTTNVREEIIVLEKKYPDFADIYFGQILRIKAPTDSTFAYAQKAEGFLKYPELRRLYDTCMIVYKDMSDIEADFKQGFTFYKHYFPNRPTPEVITHISEYSNWVATLEDDKILIGLDLFLGKDYPNYASVQLDIPAYVRRTQTKEHMVAKSFEMLIKELAGSPNGSTLLDLMIHNGRQWYIQDRLLPYMADSLKMDYTGPQTEWCAKNELEMWSFFIEKDLLYSTKTKDIQKYVGPSPDSPGMPEIAPGNTGSWLGMKIVERYMEKFPNTTFEELLKLPDAQKILAGSKYKPKKSTK